MAEHSATLIIQIREWLSKGRGQLSDRDVELLQDCLEALHELERLQAAGLRDMREPWLVIVLRLMLLFGSADGN